MLGRGGKHPKRLWGTNIGETLTNIVWAITARIIITSQNLMFYTMLWCFPNFISEIAPKWITIDGIRDVHVRIHRFAGIFLIAIPSVAHVLVIFVPPLIDGTALKYYPPSTFNFSSSPDHLNWSKFWDPAAVQGWTFNDHTGVHLTSDEIYRFLLMIVLFCFFFPLSRSNYANQKSYTLAITLHAFAGIWYAIDNIRKITHGLAHVVNLPMLIIWCVDRVLSIWLYRHHRGRIVRKKVLGNNEYVVLYVKLNKGVKYAVGDVYYLHHQFKESTGMSTQLIQEAEGMQSPSHYLLFATGSGCGYLLDVLSCLAYRTQPSFQCESQRNKHTKIDIFYSVRCKAFYNFLCKPIDELLRKISDKNTATVTFKFYVTNPEQEQDDSDATDTQIQLISGRIDFEKVLKSANKNSRCYFVGRPAIAENVENICKRKGMRLVKDYTNGRGSEEDRRLLIKYLKISFWVSFFIIAICVVAGLVIDVRSIKNSLNTHGLNATKY